MTSPIQLGKTYGVLHTESFFSFLGFAKKVGSDEIQKIDVFLDDKLIDTIEANEFIQQIDDIYDVENKAFKYNLPSEYIGKKAILSFKNHDSEEELLNSPYTLIDKNHEKFNEAKFLQSLNEPISEEIQKMYSPNSIGFLATKENLEDEEFMNYIKELTTRFPEVELKGFCFDKIQNINNSLNINGVKFIVVNSIGTLIPQIQIFISNYKNPVLSNKLYKIIQLKTDYVLFSNYNNVNEYHKKLIDVDIEYIRNIMIKNQEIFEVDSVELNTKNLYEIFHKIHCKNTNIDETIDIYNLTRHQYAFSIVIKFAFISKTYIKNLKTLDKKIYSIINKIKG